MEPPGAPRRAGEVVQTASREKSAKNFSTNRHAAPDNMDTDNCEARKVFRTLFLSRKNRFSGHVLGMDQSSRCPPPRCAALGKPADRDTAGFALSVAGEV